MIPKDCEIDRESYIHRQELKSFYKSDTGIKELSSFILLSGLLSEIHDQGEMVAHNICVRKLEEIGLLDEEGLEPLIKYMLGNDYKFPRGENDGRQ